MADDAPSVRRFTRKLRAAALILALMMGTEAPATADSQAHASGAAVVATADEADDYETAPVYDPLEPVNRKIFKFNDSLHTHVLGPVARGYARIVPAPVRWGLSNFFSNLGAPVSLANDLLQGKLRRARLEIEKFYVNTVAGLGGFIRISDDVPSLAALPVADMGETFAVWGFHDGAYLVVPLAGPSTVRDMAGRAGDYFISPFYWYPLDRVRGYRWYWGATVRIAKGVNDLPGSVNAYNAATRDALDPYIAVRDAYFQYRNAQAKKNDMADTPPAPKP